MTKHYDLISIGGGSGGLSAAERGAVYGAKCAVIESDRMGGTCVNVGCVPKKVMWYGAEIAHALKNAPSYGFDINVYGFKWARLVKAREAYIKGINDWYGNYLTDSNIDTISGMARFVDAKTLEVNGEHYSADHIVIAPGGVPSMPDTPGAELGITSDGFFALTEQSKRVAVVGAGYIAVELAGVLNALGSDVDLLLRRQHFLAEFDSMLRDTLMEEMVKDGVNVMPNISMGGTLMIPRDPNSKFLAITSSSGGSAKNALGRRHSRSTSPGSSPASMAKVTARSNTPSLQASSIGVGAREDSL